MTGIPFATPQPSGVRDFNANVGSDNLRTRRIALDNARTNERLLVGKYNFFWCYDSSTNPVVSVRFGAAANDALPVTKEFWVRGFEFDTLFITNSAQAGDYIEVAFANVGPLFDVNPGASEAGVVSIATPDAINNPASVSVADSSATLILAANTSRKEASIYNPSSTDAVFVKSTNAAASTGVVVPPGAVIFLEVTSALYAYQTSGSSISVVVSEIY